MIPIPTADEIQATYLKLAQSKLQKQDVISSPDFQAKGFAIGGVIARQALDVNRLFNAVYPQNADNFGVNTQLSAKGAPSRFSSSPTQLTVRLNGVLLGYSYSIPVGTILTSPNNVTYKVMSLTTSDSNIIIDVDHTTFSVVSLNNGANTTSNIGDVLIFQSPIIPQIPTNINTGLNTATVVDVIPGVDEESLSSAINRLIQIDQSPLDNLRVTDFAKYVISPSDGVTEAQVINANNWLPSSQVGSDTNMAVFTLSGNNINDEILNQGLIAGTNEVVYTRTSSSTIINNAKAKIIAQNLLLTFPYVSTVETQQITNSIGVNPFFKIEVALKNGYSILDNVTLNTGVTLTIKQLIQREVRRAICEQNLGATKQINLDTGVITGSSLAISTIEQQLDNTLGTSISAGDIGSFISSRTVLVYDMGNYIYKQKIPLELGIPLTANGNLAWVYDVSITPGNIYSNIEVIENV